MNTNTTPQRDTRTFSGRPYIDPDTRRVDLLQKLADLGARTADCDHGYTAFDSCPICD